MVFEEEGGGALAQPDASPPPALAAVGAETKKGPGFARRPSALSLEGVAVSGTVIPIDRK